MNKITLLIAATLASSCRAQKIERVVPDSNVILEPSFIVQVPTTFAKGSMGIVNGKIAIVNGEGTFSSSFGCKNITGKIATNAQGEYAFTNVRNDTASCDFTLGNGAWKTGSVIGSINNGHALGVISGAGKIISLSYNKTMISSDVRAAGKDGYIYSNTKDDTVPLEVVLGNCTWAAGAIMGVLDNGHAFGIKSGVGKLHISRFNGGGYTIITGDAMADGKGGCIYSHVQNDTIKIDYRDGNGITWKKGSVIGITKDGKEIGTISGEGDLDDYASGAHVTGKVKAVGSGTLVYSDVTVATTTSEFRDGASLWKAGARLGIVDDGHDIGVVEGERVPER